MNETTTPFKRGGGGEGINIFLCQRHLIRSEAEQMGTVLKLKTEFPVAHNLDQIVR